MRLELLSRAGTSSGFAQHCLSPAHTLPLPSAGSPAFLAISWSRALQLGSAFIPLCCFAPASGIKDDFPRIPSLRKSKDKIPPWLCAQGDDWRHPESQAALDGQGH